MHSHSTSNDIILFNAGDGQDELRAGSSGRKTLSLGGDFAYSDLTFSKSESHLVLRMGAADQITFQDWYAATPSRSVVKLQVIAEAMSDFAAGANDQLLDQKVESFYFTALVGAFDAVRKTAPMLSDWQLINALFKCRLTGSDDAALGGDLAYQYGRHGTLTGIGLAAAQEIVSDSGFGTQAQVLRPLSALQSGALMLS